MDEVNVGSTRAKQGSNSHQMQAVQTTLNRNEIFRELERSGANFNQRYTTSHIISLYLDNEGTLLPSYPENGPHPPSPPPWNSRTSLEL